MPVVAVPGLAILAAALLALLALLASKYLVKVIAYIIPDWHIPGFSNLRSWILNAAESSMRAVANTLDSAVGILGSYVAYPVAVLKALLDALAAGITATADTLHWVMRSGVPHLISILRVGVWAGIHALHHALTHLLHAAVRHLAHLIALARHFAAHLVHDLRIGVWKGIHGIEHLAHHLVSALAAVVATNLALANKYTRQYVAQAVHGIKVALGDVDKSIAQSLGTAEKYTDKAIHTLAGTVATTATAAAGALITDIDTAITTTAEAAWGEIDDVVKELVKVLGTDLPDIAAGLRSIPKAIPGDLALAIAALGTLAIPMLRYMRTCGIPNCRNLSQYGRDLQSLLAIVEDGALIALFAEFVSDPQAAAQDAKTILGPIADGARSIARDVLGVG